MTDSTVTIIFGAGNQIQVPATKYSEVSEILADENVVNMLGLPSASTLETRINGVVASDETLANHTLQAGDRIEFSTRANTKG